MEKGTCRMCHKPDCYLCESHFMPASLYSLVRTEEYDPVHFCQEAIYPTSKQTKYPVFCSDCEQLLNFGGENWVVPLLAQFGGPFPIRELLMRQPPISVRGAWKLYAVAENPAIDASQLMHFVVGIFYKGSVHSWVKCETRPWIDLSGEDIEALRLYLIGKADLPTHMALSITVDSAPIVWQAFVAPYPVQNHQQSAYYAFYVPGILAQLILGESAQEITMANCINANRLRPILCENVSISMRNNAREQVANAKKTRKLVATTEEIEKRGLSVRLGS